jgi:hypothetical protein
MVETTSCRDSEIRLNKARISRLVHLEQYALPHIVDTQPGLFLPSSPSTPSAPRHLKILANTTLAVRWVRDTVNPLDTVCRLEWNLVQKQDH